MELQRVALFMSHGGQVPRSEIPGLLNRVVPGTKRVYVHKEIYFKELANGLWGLAGQVQHP